MSTDPATTPVTVLVTERFPYGEGETFLGDEIDELRRHVPRVVVYPIWPHPSSRRQQRDAAMHPPVHRSPRPDAWPRILARSFALPLMAVLLIIDGLRRREFRVLAVELVAMLRAVRFVVTMGGLPIEHVHAYWMSYPATCARVIGHLLDVPWTATGHRYDLVQGLDLRGKTRQVDGIRFVSETSRRLCAVRADLSETATCVLPLGQRLPSKPVAPLIPGPMVIGIPANLVPVKGHDTAILALRILLDRGHEACLLLAGSGPRQLEIARLVDVLDLTEHVAMPGRMERDRLLELYRDGLVTVVALPSLDLGANVHEGLPIALVEAMGYGVPVVTTSTGGIPELVGPHNGVLVPQRDADALADALERLHEDPALRAQLVAEAHRSVRARFDRELVVPQLLDLMARQPQGAPA